MDNEKLCSHCYRYFENSIELSKHLKICKKKRKRNLTKISKKFKCLFCKSSYDTNDKLEEHYRKCLKKKKMDFITADNTKKLTEHLEIYGKNIKSVRFGDLMRQMAYIPHNINEK